MKKLKTIAACGLVLLLLAGCKRSDIAQNVGPVLDEWRVDHDASFTPPGQPSDITKTESSDFTAELGFSITAPSGGGLSANNFYAVDGWFGQIEYTAEAAGADEPLKLVLRIARDTSHSLATTYTETHVRGEVEEVGGVEVLHSAGPEGCEAVSWANGGFQYYLHSNKLQGAVPHDIVETLVTGLSGVDVARQEAEAGASG